MKRTLKRKLKVFEIVESEAFVVSVCLIFSFSPKFVDWGNFFPGKP